MKQTYSIWLCVNSQAHSGYTIQLESKETCSWRENSMHQLYLTDIVIDLTPHQEFITQQGLEDAEAAHKLALAAAENALQDARAKYIGLPAPKPEPDPDVSF